MACGSDRSPSVKLEKFAQGALVPSGIAGDRALMVLVACAS